MHAIVLNATLKPSPEESSTEALAGVVSNELESRGVTTETIRLVDQDIRPGVVSEAVGEGDGWPAIHEKLVAADILIMASPTWLGQPSSECRRALERMDAMLSETGDDGVPVAYNKVAGIVITGNEDGAHAGVATIAQALIDIGYTVPAQGWTYWNKGPGPGDEVYLNTSEKEWTDGQAAACAQNVHAVAVALAANPIPKPSNA